MEGEKSPQIPENLLLPKIFRTFRIAIQPSKLIIAFSAIAVICLVGRLMDTSATVVATSSYTQGAVTELQIYMTSPDRLDSFIETHKENEQAAGVFSTLWNFAREKFHGSLNALFSFNLPGVATNIGDYLKGLGWAVTYHPVYCVIFVIVKLVVIAVAGGAICRIAALEFAKGQKPGITEALRYSSKKFWSFLTTPLLPFAIIIVAFLCIFLLGLTGNIPAVGELMMGVFTPLALIAGTLITIILIGTGAGFNLMFPAIAYDGSDCFDAISRSFNYVYSRPWRMGFYTAVAAIYGAICYLFVRFFVFLLLLSTWVSLRLGVFVENSKEVNKLTAIWSQPSFNNLFGESELAAAGWCQSVAAFLIYLFLLIVVGLLVSFILSFYFSANTIIYALMRNRLDNTALDDVFALSEEEPETERAEAEEQTQQAKTQPPEAEKDKD